MTERSRFTSEWNMGHYVIIERTSDVETPQQ